MCEKPGHLMWGTGTRGQRGSDEPMRGGGHRVGRTGGQRTWWGDMGAGHTQVMGQRETGMGEKGGDRAV